MNLNEMHLMKNYLELSELYYVLSNIGPLLGDAEIRRETLFSKLVPNDICIKYILF